MDRKLIKKCLLSLVFFGTLAHASTWTLVQLNPSGVVGVNGFCNRNTDTCLYDLTAQAGGQIIGNGNVLTLFFQDNIDGNFPQRTAVSAMDCDAAHVIGTPPSGSCPSSINTWTHGKTGTPTACQAYANGGVNSQSTDCFTAYPSIGGGRYIYIQRSTHSLNERWGATLFEGSLSGASPVLDDMQVSGQNTNSNSHTMVATSPTGNDIIFQAFVSPAGPCTISSPYSSNYNAQAHFEGTASLNTSDGTAPTQNCTGGVSSQAGSAVAWSDGASQAPAPVCTPSGGTYSTAQTVTCTDVAPVMCSASSGTPKTDGVSGCLTGNLVTAPFFIPLSQTLIVVAGGTGYADSSLSTNAYTINAPYASVSPSTLIYAARAVGSTSPIQNVTFTNIGSAGMLIASISVTGDYAQTNTCPNSSTPLLAGTSCSVSLTFTPTTLGDRPGVLTFTDNSTGNSGTIQTVTLDGTGGSTPNPGFTFKGGFHINPGVKIITTAPPAPVQNGQIPSLPLVWVDNNELNCKLTSSCQTGSPGNLLTAPAYDMNLSTGAPVWTPSAPPGCTFSASYWGGGPTDAQRGSGIQTAINEVEACKTGHNVGIIVDRPGGVGYATTNGLVIPQSNATTTLSVNPIILRTTSDSTIAALTMPVCAGGLQDNVSVATAPGLINDDCTGKNMYFQNGPQNGGGNWQVGTPGLLTGFTTVSVNTYGLSAISTGGTVGPSNPSSSGVQGSGGAWSGVDRVKSNSGTASFLTPAGNTVTSQFIYGSGFPITLPPGATITGISFSFSRQVSTVTSNSANTVQVFLLKAGTAAGTAKGPGSSYTTSLTTESWGNSSDLWGTTWTASDINNPGFGVEISAIDNAGPSPATVGVNNFLLTVTYTLPGAQLLPLDAGYVSPTLLPTVSGSNSGCATGLIVVDSGVNKECVAPVSGSNTVGLYGVFTKNHAAGAVVTYVPDRGAGSGTFTLANGTNANISSYNYAQYLAHDYCTTMGCVPVQLCNHFNSGTNTSPVCANDNTSGIGPDHWQLTDMEMSFCSLYDTSGNLTGCASATSNTFVFDFGNSVSETDPTFSHFAHDIHLRRVYLHGDMRSLGSGGNALASALSTSGCIYCSVIDFQISQAIRPGGEGHAMGIDGNNLKIAYGVARGQSSGVFFGGSLTQPGVPTFIPGKNVEIRDLVEGYPYQWLGFQCAYSTSNNTNSGNGCGNVPDYNPNWGGAGDNYPFVTASISAVSSSLSTVTLTVSSTTGFSTGNNLTITGLETKGCNGTFHVNVVSPSTLTYNDGSCGESKTDSGNVTLAPTCGLGATANTTCVTISGTTATWVSGPPFHDSNSSPLLWPGGVFSLYYDNLPPIKANIAGSWTSGTTCLLGDFFLYSTAGNCPKTLTLKTAPGDSASPIPFVFNGQSLVRKNADEMKQGAYVLKAGIIYESVDNSGGQVGISTAAGVRQDSGANYNANIHDVTIENTIARHTCTGRGAGARSLGQGNGNGVSLQERFMSWVNNLDYDVTFHNPGCSTNDSVFHPTSGNQEWNALVTCSAATCSATAIASVDAGIALTGDVSCSGGSCTYTTKVTDLATNASICGPNNQVLVVGFLAQQGNNSPASSAYPYGNKCTASTSTSLTLTNATGVTVAGDSTGSPVANPVFNTSASSSIFSQSSQTLYGFWSLGMVSGDSMFVKSQNPTTANCPFAVSTHAIQGQHDIATAMGPIVITGAPVYTGDANGNSTAVGGGWNTSFLQSVYQWGSPWGTATGSDITGNCIVDNILGGPLGMTQNHYTVVTDSVSPVGGVQQLSNGANLAKNFYFTNSIFLSEPGAANAGWYNPSFGTSSEGKQTELIDTDQNSMTDNYLLFAGRSSASTKYWECGNNPNYPGIGACTGTPVTLKFTANNCGVGFNGTGSWAFGSCTGDAVNIEATDYHQYQLNAGSTYHNSGSDGKDLGAIIPDIDTALIQNTYVCKIPCATPGPYPIH